MTNPDLPFGIRNAALDALDARFMRGALSRRQFIRASLALGVTSVAAAALADTLEAARANQDARAANLGGEYEVIVCGGGTSGCTLAGQLAAAGVSVLLLEAGGWDDAESVLMPGRWFTNLGAELDWGDIAVPTAGVNGRATGSHMGRVLGGGSSINATIWARGHRADYDGWAEAAGAARWSYDSALSVFRQVENWQGAPSDYRGVGGPVWVQPAADPLPIAPAMLEAAIGLGLPVFDDLNGAREETAGGFALMNQIIRDGRRVNMAQAFLYPVMDRENLTVLLGAHVDRLLIEGGRAVGVQATRAGESLSIRATRAVVLSQGAIRTPQTLMLSGIGDSAHLAEHGIGTVLNAPEVGLNFHDHILHGGCIWESPEPMQLTNSGANAAGFWKSDPSLDRPDLNIVQIELPYASEAVAREFAPPAAGWALCAGLVGPKSRGSVRLRSANPADAPIVTANFLAEEADVKALMAGIDLCRRIGNAPQLARWAKREAAPGSDLDAAAKADFARNGVTSFFHQVGTCRMGSDDAAVVGADLHVKGLDGLIIADGSIMPRIVSCATMATCVFIGMQGADLVPSA